MVRAGEVSPTELVQASLERIERIDPQLNAFRVVLAERALAEAQQAEARLRAGDERPLLGVPIALKDGVDLAGEPTTHGTDSFSEPVGQDSEMVARLRGAGAIVVGKTNLPELAIWGFTESATWGVTRNPWDPQRSCGGSSGGSAAAVAAGLVPVASASDGAGSIRIPASSCGIFGLKPTRGRVSMEPDALVKDASHWNGMSVNGCVSRTVIDSALYLDVTAGGSREAGAPPPPERPFADAAKSLPAGLRIAYSTQPMRGLAPPILSDEVAAAVTGTAQLLGSLGHSVTERDPDFGMVGNQVIPRYLRGIHEDVETVPHKDRLELRGRQAALLGRLVSERFLERARGTGMEADRQRIWRIFDEFDVLITPVMGGTAIPIRHWEGRGALRIMVGQSRFYGFTPVWNHLGNPAASVPAGFGADGLPLAVQLIGRYGDEATLLSLSAQLEAERPWADRMPPVS
jgi:amidase